MNLLYLGFITSAGYIATGFWQGFELVNNKPISKFTFWFVSFLLACGHGFVLYKLIETPYGQNLDWLIMLSMTLWFMNLFVFLTSLNKNIEKLSIISYPLAAIALVFPLIFHDTDILATKNNPLIIIHIFMSIFAVSLLLLAGCQALFLGLCHKLLKKPKSGTLVLKYLPPLQSLEALLFNIILLGVLFLSGSLISGVIKYNVLLEPHLLPKVIFSITAWGLFSSLLIGHWRFGWRGPLAVKITTFGVFFVFLSYFGTKAFLSN